MKTLLVLLFFFSINSWSFDHQYTNWDAVLKKIVKKEGNQSLVNYQLLKKDNKKLNQFLLKLSAVKLSEYNSWSELSKLSFLINSYNAFTIDLIIKDYPVKSIKDIGSLFTSSWKKKFFTLLEKERHLDWIEHEMIRKNFKEPRIHFAVVCASISCPNLQSEAFTEKNIERLLDRGAREFLTDPNKNVYSKGILKLSKIFKWYAEDFGPVGNFVAGYMTRDMNLLMVLKNPKISIEWQDYNWELNEWK